MNFNNWLYTEKQKLNKATSEQLKVILKLEKDNYLKEVSDKSCLTKEEAKHLINRGLQEMYKEEMDKYYSY